ncbi:hypothetical protein GCM10023237_70230 [Streptomyces coeruleoprunus]|uniref:hypothetical protein n=1 Tax=Streptomyces coeruleoprunus TaxID=285563 RepID=UPI0031EACA69
MIVLTDRNRRLTPAQVRLEFAAREGGPRRPVRVERTDAYEIVGVLDDDTDRTFTGFTVPARARSPCPSGWGSPPTPAPTR